MLGDKHRTYHGGDGSLLLQVFDNLALVSRLHTREQSGMETGTALLFWTHFIKLTSRERQS